MNGIWESGQNYFRPRSRATLSLVDPQPAWAEPFEVGEVQRFLNLPERNPPDLIEEDLLRSMIQAAREFAEIAQGRDLVRKQWELEVHSYGQLIHELRSPLVSVDQVQRRSEDAVLTDLVEGTGYRVDISRGVLYTPFNDELRSWSSTGITEAALIIRFTSGYLPGSIFWSDAGARIKTGMRYLISAWFFNRLPFSEGGRPPAEFPYAVTSCLSHGSLVRLS
jgi:uncharacterized phiE125 gp8 family phage protein